MSKPKMNKQEFMDKLLKKGRTDIALVDEYIDSKTKVLFKCTKENCGYEWPAIPAQVLYGTGCPKCNGTSLKTNDEFLKEFSKKGNQNILILGQYTGRDHEILVKCKIDGYEWNPLAKSLLRGTGCPVCAEKVVIPGINSLADVRPDLLIYFNDKSDAYKIAPQSTNDIVLQCPDCGAVRTMRASDLFNQGFNCQVCGDNVSYPNRFIRCIMGQLKECMEELKYEWTPKWVNRKRYDVYFVKDSKMYVIEMQGLQHYEDCGWSDKTIDEIIAEDKYKIDIAVQNNVCPIIIDARFSDADFIKKNINNSILSQIFDLSVIDWVKCKSDATSNIVKQICYAYEADQNILISELADKFHISRRTVSNYLKRGSALGWCMYSIDKPHERHAKRMKKIRV